MGPVSYLIVEFPGGKLTGKSFPLLLDLVDRGLIHILDFKLVKRDLDGGAESIELVDVDHDGTFDFALFEGVSSGLLDDSDLAEAAGALEPGSAAAVLLYENHWATAFVEALRGSGAEIVAAGYIPHDELTASLDATEGASI